jgi:hypothetical protein
VAAKVQIFQLNPLSFYKKILSLHNFKWLDYEERNIAGMSRGHVDGAADEL